MNRVSSVLMVWAMALMAALIVVVLIISSMQLDAEIQKNRVVGDNNAIKLCQIELQLQIPNRPACKTH